MRNFNLSEWALRNRALVVYAMLVLALVGAWSYKHLGQSEDPPFTFKAMVVRTLWPGATGRLSRSTGATSSFARSRWPPAATIQSDAATPRSTATLSSPKAPSRTGAERNLCVAASTTHTAVAPLSPRWIADSGSVNAAPPESP